MLNVKVAKYGVNAADYPERDKLRNVGVLKVKNTESILAAAICLRSVQINLLARWSMGNDGS